MTVNANDTVERYDIDGTGPYAFSFRIFAKSDLIVRVFDDIEDEPLELTLSTHYNIADASVDDEDGGELTLTASAASTYDGYTLDIRSETPRTQPTALSSQGAYSPRSIEAAFDRLSRQIQDFMRIANLGVRAPDWESAPDMVLPSISERANKFLYFGAGGLPEPATGLEASQVLSSSVIATTLNSLKRTAAEIAAGVTPTDYSYTAEVPIIDPRRFGMVVGGTASAVRAGNDTAIAAAIAVAEQLAGAIVQFPAGTIYTDQPIIVPNKVSIRGMGKDTTLIKKTTNTASAITDNTVPWYSSPTSVGAPICVFQFVEGASSNWADGHVQDIGVEGDTTSPNTSAVLYGFFFRGATNPRILACQAKNVRVGFFIGAGATIVAQIMGCVAFQCHRSFYIDFATSLTMGSNYSVKCRYLGYDYAAYYAAVFANACDSGGHADVRVNDTEICLAYYLRTVRGGFFAGNGSELHNGPVLKLEACTSLWVFSNLNLAIWSNHDNVASGSSIYAVEFINNTDITFLGNRFSFAVDADDGIDKLEGDAQAGSHYNWRVTGQLGYMWADDTNRWVDGTSSIIAAGWTNTSGTIPGLSGTYTGTLTGCTTSPTGTLRYQPKDNVVTLYIPTLSATSNTTAMTITGMPAAIRPARQQRCHVRVQDNGVTNEGSCIVETSGVLSLSFGPTETSWTASGTKGIFYSTITYLLT